MPLVENVVSETFADQVVVSWRYTHTGGVNLIRVVVEVRIGLDGAYQLASGGNLSNPNLTRFSVPGHMLQAGELYQYRVTATNALGESEPIEMDPFVAQIGRPFINYRYDSSLARQPTAAVAVLLLPLPKS